MPVHVTFRARLLQGFYLELVGVVFAFRGLLALQDADFWNATTWLDYAAVWTFSLALLLIAPALIIAVRQANSGRVVTAVAWIMAAGALLGAVANAIEDGFGQKDFGTLYILGAGTLGYGLILLAALMVFGRRKVFAIVPALTLVGLFAFDDGGGLLVGAVWATFGVLIMSGRTETAPATAATPSREGRI